MVDESPDEGEQRPRRWRKWPPGIVFEGWIDRQIREAIERGEFDNLPGAGNPIPNLDDNDENWWIKSKLEREGIKAPLPNALALRREVEEIQRTLADVKSEPRPARSSTTSTPASASSISIAIGGRSSSCGRWPWSRRSPNGVGAGRRSESEICEKRIPGPGQAGRGTRPRRPSQMPCSESGRNRSVVNS